MKLYDGNPYRKNPNGFKLCLSLLTSLIVIFLWSNTTYAVFGTPHIIYGKVFNSDGTPPQEGNLEIYAYIPERPQEILDRYSNGCGYGLDSYSDGWLWFEAGNFITIWSVGESLRIIAVDPFSQETGVVDLVLDTSGSQHITDLYLSDGDNVGPITYNALVDGTVYAFIPEGTSSITLSATVDDSLSGNSNIQEAEYFIDTDPGYGFGTLVEPVDGLFDSPFEEVTASVDTSSWSEGSIHTIHVRGQDSAGNWGTAHLVSIEVIPPTYQFMGFLPPIENDGSSVFKLGRTIPVKFQLKDTTGNFGYNGTALLTLQEYVGDVPAGPPVDATSSGDSNIGNEFRYDEYDNLYIYNLKTKPLSAGKWKLIVTLENGDIYEVFIELR